MSGHVQFTDDPAAALSAPAPARDPLAALTRFALTVEQVEKMQQTRMIGRGVLGHQHLVALLGAAGSGKTAVATDFLARELAQRYRVLYFQEDASAGDLPRLHEHASQCGYQLLNSTLAGCSTEDQLSVLRDLAKSGHDLSDVVMIFDTVKKYADLMSKGGTRAFLTLMRSLTLRGATVLLLGHTNKHRGPDGKLMFEGVGDVRNDVDELLYIEAGEKDAAGMVTMTIKPDKARCVVREVSFQLDTATMQVIELPRVVDVAAELADRKQREEDAELITATCAALASGGTTHSELIKRVCADTGQGRNAVAKVVNRYLGDDPSDERALWLETRIRLNNTRHVSLKPRGDR
jgi:hypothetical protein